MEKIIITKFQEIGRWFSSEMAPEHQWGAARGRVYIGETPDGEKFLLSDRGRGLGADGGLGPAEHIEPGHWFMRPKGGFGGCWKDEVTTRFTLIEAVPDRAAAAAILKKELAKIPAPQAPQEVWHKVELLVSKTEQMAIYGRLLSKAECAEEIYRINQNQQTYIY